MPTLPVRDFRNGRADSYGWTLRRLPRSDTDLHVKGDHRGREEKTASFPTERCPYADAGQDAIRRKKL